MIGPVLVFTMPGVSHLTTLQPVIERLASRGVDVRVMGDAEQRAVVERSGARLDDMCGRHSLDLADPSSYPIPSRHVSYAGVYGELVADEVEEISPSLILYETFSLIAPVVARRLGVPYVNVCPNRDAVPASIERVRLERRVVTSAECLAAVERLKSEHGMADANPFSYYAAVSPFLNLYPEPPEFLPGEDVRAALQPLRFFGSLAPALRGGGGGAFGPRRGRGRLFVAFGTVVWFYYEREALAAMEAIAAATAALDLDVVMSLGGHEIAESDRVRLEHEHVRVAGFVDQWEVLREADVFLTHHGLNSTHEAIHHGVPMISYPFWGDQPGLAARCRELGLAVPLVGELRGPVPSAALGEALSAIEATRDGFATRLAEARDWELRTMAARDDVVDEILELAT